MSLDLDALERTGTATFTADDLIALVKIARAAVAWRHLAAWPFRGDEALLDALREAGL